MPRYELSVIYKILERPELVQAIKRTSEAIIQRGGIIRSMENLGSRRLPYKMFKHGLRYENGNYILVQFESPTKMLVNLSEHLHLDLDVIRPRILRMEEEVSRPCKHRACDFGEMTPEMQQRLKDDLQNFIRQL